MLPRRYALVSLFFILGLACGASFSLGQTIAGSIHGTVTDSSGAVVPDAEVQVQRLATGTIRKTQTNSAGFYAVPQIPPGGYSIATSKSGFATAVQENVQLQVNQDIEMNFTLNPGAVTQHVEVTAAPPSLNTTNATIGQTIGTHEVENLPLNGRQFTQLILLTPGAAPKEGGQQAFFVIPIGGGGISPGVDGQGGRKNFFSLDGMMNDAIFTNSWAVSPPPDAVEEFKVQTHITDAEFGVSSGANVNLAIKSGGNKFHGDAYEFVRNDKLDAANFFDNATGTIKPPFRQNQYGVTAGGPLYIPHLYDGVKNHTYVFGYWEGFRSREGHTIFGNFPTPDELSGNFSSSLTNTLIGTDCAGNSIYAGEIFNPYATHSCPGGNGYYRDPFAGNQIPSGMLNAPALTYLKAFYPAPNFGSGGFPNYAAALPTAINNDQYGFKVNHTFRNNDMLYGGYYYTNPTQDVPTVQLLGANTRLNEGRLVSLGYTHTFDPTTLLTVHYGYNYTKFGQIASAAGLDLMQAVNSAGFEPLKEDLAYVPQASFTGGIDGTNQFAIPLGPMRIHQLSGDFVKVHGHHTFGIGGMVYHIHSFSDGFGMTVNFDNFPSASPGQPQSGNALASMLLNLPSGLFGFLGRTQADNTGNWYGGYLQDKWQVSKKLSIQYGLRYDFVSPMSFKDGQASGVDPAGNFLITQAVPPQFPFRTVRSTYFDAQYDGFQPRVGIAYAATPKTVLRAGFGIFDDSNAQRVQYYGDVTSVGWPWAAGVSDAGLNQDLPTVFFDSLPSASTFFDLTSPPSVAYGEDPHMRTAYTMEWNFDIQREIAPGTTLDVGYVGSGSRHGFTTTNWNMALQPGSTPLLSRVPFPQYGIGITMDASWGTGNYDGLQVKLNRQFSNGFSLLAAYTWSHCDDIQSEGDSGDILNFYNRKWDYGLCDFDFRHMFTYSSLYALPFGRGKRFGGNLGGVPNAIIGGWNLSGILSLYAGSPFTVSISSDNANVGVGGQRPLQVGDPVPSGFHQDVSHWYDPSAFQIPAPYTYGNLGRNTLRGPGTAAIDMSIYKEFVFTESSRLEFRTDFFNLPNHPLFAPPGAGSGSRFGIQGGAAGDCLDCGTAGQILSAGPGREIQFSLKLVW